MKQKVLYSVLCLILLFSLSGATTFTNPVQVTSNSTTNAQYPALDLDDEFYSDDGGWIGNAHVVWTEENNDVWHTYYRVVDPYDNLSVIETVHRDDVCGTVYIDHLSEAPTTPDVMVDNSRDLANICFCYQKKDWFYNYEPEDYVRELLFLTRKNYV